ncbi:MAG: Flp pilus assembly protein CpaB [Actinomycetota bacterium]
MRRRWSPTSKVFAVLAIASGLGAFALVHGYERQLEALRPAVGSPVQLVEAARSLSRGTVLTQDAVTVAEVPSVFVPPGAVRTLEQAVGRTLVSDLLQGEIVTRTRVGVDGGPVASQIPSGLRAFTVPSGMPPGTVRPGDRVDVLATFGGQSPHTETVSSGLEILLVLDEDPGSAGFAPQDAGPALVLLVSPDAAEHLAYAKAFADLTVVVAPTSG